MTPENESPQLLRMAFKFTEDDWALNQQGSLSLNQRNKYWWRILGQFLMALINLFAIISAIALANDTAQEGNLLMRLPFQGWLNGLALLIFLLGVVLRVFASVEEKTGVAELSTSVGSLMHFIKLGDRTFSLSPTQYYALQDGHRYQVYFIFNMILSIQPLQNSEKPKREGEL